MMTDRKKMGTQMNASQQIQDGTVDELLLSKELLQRFSAMEQRIEDLEKRLGETDNADPVAAYQAAKN